MTKNHETYSKIGFPQKIDFRADRTQGSHPKAWELMKWVFELKIFPEIAY